MNAIELKCNAAGTIEIVRAVEFEANRTDESGALASYQAQTPESLHKIAANYDNVVRANGKTIRGNAYTARMAQNDFNALV